VMETMRLFLSALTPLILPCSQLAIFNSIQAIGGWLIAQQSQLASVSEILRSVGHILAR
jgi:hypothetical protein